LIFNITYDSSVNSAPAAFKTTIAAVVQFLQSHFSNPITINIDVGYGEIANQPMGPGALGESETYLNSYSYAQIKSALASHATSADDASAVNSLPANSPVNGTYWVATAESKVLGLMGASGALDGFAGFSGSPNIFDYDESNGISPGQYDFFAVVAHEFTEIMGRMLFVGNSGPTSNSYSVMDLFHYSGPGGRDFVGTQAGYFSPDGGNTNLDNFNTNPNGDFGDWAGSAGNDSFLAFSPSGVVNAVTQADLRVMDVLGYTLGAPTAAVSPPFFLGTGDLAGDHTSDALWQNTDGSIVAWELIGAQLTSSATVGVMPSNWHFSATGDVNGDGKSDMLWHSDAGGIVILEMNGTQVIANQYIGQIPSNWHVAGSADFNGDGTSDILLNSDAGGMVILTMNGTQIAANQFIGQVPSNWHVAGTGDFNADGRSDILLHDDAGDLLILAMNGGQIIANQYVGQIPVNWHVAGTGDFNADGRTDILLNSDTNGIVLLEMNGGQVLANQFMQGPANFQFAGIGDFDGNNTSDIMWTASNGTVQVWEMNGTQVAASQTVTGGALAASGPPAAADAPVTPLASTLFDPDAAEHAGIADPFALSRGAAPHPFDHPDLIHPFGLV